MEPTIRFVQHHWRALLLPFSVTGITILVGLTIRYVIFRSFRRWAAGTKSKLDDVIVEALHGPFMIWVIMLALHLGTQTSKLPIRAQNTGAQILLVLFIVSMTLVFSRLAALVVRLHASPEAFSTLTENLARIVVVLLGGMIVLNTLGISILPILTALGVGGIAVALSNDSARRRSRFHFQRAPFICSKANPG